MGGVSCGERGCLILVLLTLVERLRRSVWKECSTNTEFLSTMRVWSWAMESGHMKLTLSWGRASTNRFVLCMSGSARFHEEKYSKVRD